MTEVAAGTPTTGVAPLAVLGGHPDDEPADRVHAPWAARSATAAAGTQRGGGDGKPASYSGVNGASRLLFSYTVVEGHEDTNGISINANELTHNGATIVDAADSTKNAVLTHGVEPADPDHKVDGVRPVFQSATIFPADPDRIERWTFLHLHFDGEFEDSSTGGVALNVRSEKVFSEFTVSGIPVAPGRYRLQRSRVLVHLQSIGPDQLRHAGHGRWILRWRHRDPSTIDTCTL